MDTHRPDSDLDDVATTETAESLEDARVALDNQAEELRSAEKKLQEMRGRLAHMKEGSDEREQELDGLRLELMRDWQSRDESVSRVRESSDSLRRRRAALGERQQDLSNASMKLQVDSEAVLDLMRTVGETKPIGRNEVRYMGMIGEFQLKARRSREAKETLDEESKTLTSEINTYNSDYDALLEDLTSLLNSEKEWIERATSWVGDRKEHNENVTESAEIQKKIEKKEEALTERRERLWAERLKWRADVQALVGPYVVDEAERRRLVGAMKDLLWKNADRDMVGVRFEILCVDLLRALEIEAERVGGKDDGGIDIVGKETTPSGLTFKSVFQCKFRSGGDTVGRSDVSKFAGDRPEDRDVVRAVLMTTGLFEEEAERRAREKNVELWDGQKLVQFFVDSSIGFENDITTSGHEVSVDEEYWADLVARATEEKNADGT